jgi:hypothetical protein
MSKETRYVHVIHHRQYPLEVPRNLCSAAYNARGLVSVNELRQIMLRSFIAVPLKGPKDALIDNHSGQGVL